MVFRRDQHIRAELAVLRREAQPFALRQKLLVERNGGLRPRRADEARAAAMAHVAVERELAHDEDAAADVGKAQIHLIIFIPEHAQTEDLLGQLAAFFRRIVRRDAEQDQKSLPNLPVNFALNGDRRGFYPRDNCFHINGFSKY